MLVRSPTLTKRLFSSMTHGSSPESRRAGGTTAGWRGAPCVDASAIAAMCSGVVPQQPPTMLTSPEVANSPTTRAIASGVSSYSPNALGSPAFGWANTKQSAMREKRAAWGAHRHRARS